MAWNTFYEDFNIYLKIKAHFKLNFGCCSIQAMKIIQLQIV